MAKLFPRYRYNPSANFAGGALAVVKRIGTSARSGSAFGKAKSFVKSAIGGVKRKAGGFIAARPKLRSLANKTAYGAGKVAGSVRRKVGGLVNSFRPKRPKALPGTSFSRQQRQLALFHRIERTRTLKRIQQRRLSGYSRRYLP